MFEMTLPWWELVLRASIIYVFLLVLIRLTGKKKIGEFAPFDLILLLILSESVQNAMASDEKSVTGGLILAAALIGLNHLMSYLTFKSKKIEDIVEGTPKVLVSNGKIHQETMNKEQVTEHDLHTAMRHEGINSLKKIRLAVLETDGKISIVEKAG